MASIRELWNWWWKLVPTSSLTPRWHPRDQRKMQKFVLLPKPDKPPWYNEDDRESHLRQIVQPVVESRNVWSLYGDNNNHGRESGKRRAEFWRLPCQVWMCRFKGTLVDTGVPWYLTSLIKNYLSERSLWYGKDDDLKEYVTTAGIPQGSVLDLLPVNIIYYGVLAFPIPEGKWRGDDCYSKVLRGGKGPCDGDSEKGWRMRKGKWAW